MSFRSATRPLGERTSLGSMNGRINDAGGRPKDQYPVVKLFTPDANATWLLTELDPVDEDLCVWPV